MKRADLHTHTYYSDGGQSPEDVILSAKKNGVDIVAITDHDNSFARTEGAACAKTAGLIFVEGEEVSAYDGDVKIHILCYGLDYEGATYKAFYKKCRDGAEERTFDILKKLNACGVKLSYGDVLRERKCPDVPIHGMYIARAGARKGYAPSPVEFYVRYLNYGTVGFSTVCRPTPEETVEMCVECGGICSVAHPGRISLDDDGVVNLVKRLVPLGLNGIEAVYSGHTEKQTKRYKELAKDFSLYVTGGSDTHYSCGNRRVGEPPFYPSEELLHALKII